MLRRSNRSLLLVLLILPASTTPAGGRPTDLVREVWEPCVVYDKGTLPDGRRVWRSIQVERRFDGSCPMLDDPCVWADINWDGYAGGSDFVDLNLCNGRELDYLRE
ncbi:MAG: hypothetical protein QNK04_04375 [Myxococcota bacterium]|nr:hypothetical protein [Myxococcota bacterium]